MVFRLPDVECRRQLNHVLVMVEDITSAEFPEESLDSDS